MRAAVFPGTSARRSGDRRDSARSRRSALLRVLVLAVLPATVTADPLQEIVVTASQFREEDLARVPASITALDGATIAAASVQHFEELVPLVPNLNWSGEGSRARYFQVRGTGELEQYQGAPNPSVGFIVDDVDLSGIGGAATTFDAGRIEVLRGPQGTRYGANALAGLIYVETAQPGAEPVARVEATAGTDNTRALGAVLGGPLAGEGERLAGRLAVQQSSSDGFRTNQFLGRDDTSNRDELTVRAKLRWQPGSDTSAQLTVFHVDLDNGYDDFALDNGYNTYSDRPGEDSQVTDALALRATLGLGAVANLVSITGLAATEAGYGFDADWGNAEFWAPYVYDFTQRIARDRDTFNQELRLVSRPDSRVLGADWLVGLYALRLTEAITQRDTANCPAATCGEDLIYDLTGRSDYDATSLAGYGELGWALTDATRLTAGLRREVRDASYRDSSGARLDPTDRMTGGDLTLTHALSAGTKVPDTMLGAEVPDTTLWARVARGYKAGGFNPSVVAVPEGAGKLQFGPEFLWNYEVGARLSGTDGSWWASASVFLQERHDQQIKIPQQFRPGDPTTFLFLTENAARGRNTGVELELGWQPLEHLELGAALGLLDTEISRFAARPELEGRELAHAPRYSFAVHGTWRTTAGWFLRADYSGKDGYYIDYCQTPDCNDPQTAAYQVLDLRAGRQWGAWSLEAWCRNVLDREYAVRGFFFGNEPPAFEPALYTRLGDPRHAGLTVRYAW